MSLLSTLHSIPISPHPLYSYLLNLNSQLAKVLLVPHILICILHLIEREDLLVNHRLDLICVNCTVL
jgi:hypothetical protein